MKTILLILVLSTMTSSCIFKDEKTPLIFEIKPQAEALSNEDESNETNAIGDDKEDSVEEEKFSFEKSPATYENVLTHILEDKCVFCHSSDFAQLGVDLSEYDKVFGTSDFFTPIVLKDNPEESGLYLEVESGRMPPGEPLEPEEIAFIKKWIEEGAVE